MRRPAVLVFLAAFTAAVLLAQGHKVPAQSEFRDDGADRIRSDSEGAYADGDQCVTNYVDTKSGFYFLRTVSYDCDPERSLDLDFSDWVDGGECPLDPALGLSCGPNTLPDVRLITTTLFPDEPLRHGTKRTPVTLAFSLEVDFSATAFLLEFEQPLAVGGDSDSYMRTLTADSMSVAELYRLEKTFRKVSLGRFYMPFQVTVTKQ